MATTTTTSSKSPWEPIVPYLTGQNGILPTAQQNFQNAQWSPQMQTATNNFLTQQGVNSGITQNVANNGWSLANNPFAGVDKIGTVSAGPAAQGAASQASFNLSNLGLGSAPQDAYNRMLTGKADTTTLDPVVQAALRRTTDAFNESVMPSIRGGAQAAGQYGGSRQGIAEGIAAKGLSQSLADASAGMYNSAYDRAQGMMSNAAGQLGGFSTSIANNNAALGTQASLANAASQNQMNQFNAGLGQQANMFNANLGFQNHNAYLNDITTGTNLLGTSMNMGNTNYNNTMQGLNAPNQFNNANLNQYANVVNQAAGQGGSASQSTPYYQNNAANNLGLGIGLIGGGYELGKNFGWWGG